MSKSTSKSESWLKIYDVKGTSWRHKLVMTSKCVMTSKNTSWRPKYFRKSKVCHVKSLSWHQKHVMTSENVMASTIRHDAKIRHNDKNYIMTSEIRHDVKKFVMMSICSTWRQNVRHNTSWRYRVRHDVQNVSWRRKVRHNIKKYVKKFVMMVNTSKSSLWRLKVRQQVRHDVNNTSWRHAYVMPSKIRHDVRNILHDVNKFAVTLKSMLKRLSWCQKISWRQNVRHDVNKYVMTIKGTSWRERYVKKVHHGVKRYVTVTSCRQSYIMMSRIRHDAKNLCYDYYDAKKYGMR